MRCIQPSQREIERIVEDYRRHVAPWHQAIAMLLSRTVGTYIWDGKNLTTIYPPWIQERLNYYNTRIEELYNFYQGLLNGPE